MPKLMTKTQAENYAKTSQRGPSAYILIYGVLLWGVVSGLLFTTYIAISTERGFLDAAKVILPIFMVGGVFWGLFTWVIGQSRYRIYQINQDDPS